MISFKEFLLEAMEPYRSGWRGIKRFSNVSQYDPEYYEKQPEKLSDDGRSIGWRQKLVPKKQIISRPSEIISKSDDVIHRGMSHDEYQNILKHGKIQSRGSGNIGGEQKGLTYFSTDPDSAASYANTFAMRGKTPTPDKPAYIVSIKRPHPSRIKSVSGTGEHEVGVEGEISADDIVAVHKGHVIQHQPADLEVSSGIGSHRGPYGKQQYLQAKKQGSVSGSDAMSRLHWERIK